MSKLARVQRAALLLARVLLVAGALAACASRPPPPPDHLDRSLPAGAFRVFRGAVAQEDIFTEWICLSDGFRRRFGVPTRAEYRDARQVALKQDSLAIRGILRAEVERGESLPDGRVLLHLDLPLWLSGRVWMKRQDVLRIEFNEKGETPVYLELDERRLGWGKDVAGIVISADDVELLADDLAEVAGFRRFFAGTWWFIDDFEFGKEKKKQAGQ